MASRAKEDGPKEPPSPRGRPVPRCSPPSSEDPGRDTGQRARPKKARQPRGPRGRARRALTPPLDYVARTRHGPVNLIFLAPWVLVASKDWNARGLPSGSLVEFASRSTIPAALQCSR